ncbi:MAG: DUF362 domain-containing protein [Deltaproteobacteria bacterium]|nr:DUF362 domain-containing protein [Deltaproteobacteria bacterium]
MINLSITKGENRKENVRSALDLIAEDIEKRIGRRQVVIKPNFVSSSRQLASSHVDQMRGILDFLKGFHKGKIIVSEAASGDTRKAFKNFGYDRLIDEYDVQLIDLNHSPFRNVAIRDSEGRNFNVRVSDLLLDRNNYVISAAKLKAHDTVVVTLSIKNMAMGAVLYPDKMDVHQGIRRTNLNIAALAGLVWPDLSVIDGLDGMEGNGPVDGDPIHVGIAIAGTDPLAVDRVACEVMMVDFNKVGYLNHCVEMGLGEADLKKIDMAGVPISECACPFRLHGTVEKQYHWRN